MNIKSFLALKFAKIVRKQISKWADNPLATQDKVFQYLIQNAAFTQFGKDHHFEKFAPMKILNKLYRLEIMKI
jgi:hypothetical protein